jgi:hypothetical protein
MEKHAFVPFGLKCRKTKPISGPEKEALKRLEILLTKMLITPTVTKDERKRPAIPAGTN